MPFTKAHTRIVADMLNDEAQVALCKLSGRLPMDGTITQDTIDDLESLELARKDVNLMDGKDVLIITSRGKKVAECL